MPPFAKFFICAFMIFFAGSRLTKYADVIAEKTDLGHAWIGLVLLAAVTSLPELFNGISAVALVRIPDLAVGNILGACLVNMAVIGGIDIYQFIKRKNIVFSQMGNVNRISVYFGLLIIIVFGAGVVLAKEVFDFVIFGVGIYSVMIFAVYLLAQYFIFHMGKGRDRTEEVIKYQHLESHHIYLKFIFFALIVVAAGIWLPYIGKEMAEAYGLGKTFIGVFFLGLATTMPELVVSSTALKYSVAMSVGNLVGSNIFNFSLLFIDDIFYQPGSLLGSVSFSQFIAGLFLIFSFLLVIFAIITRTRSRMVSLFLVLSYLAGIYTVFLLK